ncbi:hypothetical protein BT96DRAFT_140347 [Gymnopus androsaceus JB14]|uniref:Uncharacterized protein n=1 Tax=Gymnopus androsaceus JB14 TaxID=1447944 RepID=A0A6A4HFC8_9AGAR|nr:hypothetical protein BT96DRAFT_140347 [Gymnopus androsaceus JB14]
MTVWSSLMYPSPCALYVPLTSPEGTPVSLVGGSQDTQPVGEARACRRCRIRSSIQLRFASSPPAADDLAMTDAERIRD